MYVRTYVYVCMYICICMYVCMCTHMAMKYLSPKHFPPFQGWYLLVLEMFLVVKGTMASKT